MRHPNLYIPYIRLLYIAYHISIYSKTLNRSTLIPHKQEPIIAFVVSRNVQKHIAPTMKKPALPWTQWFLHAGVSNDSVCSCLGRQGNFKILYFGLNSFMSGSWACRRFLHKSSCQGPSPTIGSTLDLGALGRIWRVQYQAGRLGSTGFMILVAFITLHWWKASYLYEKIPLNVLGDEAA